MTATMRIADMVDVSRGILSGPISRAQRNHVVAYGASGTSIYPPEGKTAMRDDDLRTALRSHWAASDANDFATEHQIYRTDAVLEYPQSGERIRGGRTFRRRAKRSPTRSDSPCDACWVAGIFGSANWSSPMTDNRFT